MQWSSLVRVSLCPRLTFPDATDETDNECEALPVVLLTRHRILPALEERPGLARPIRGSRHFFSKKTFLETHMVHWSPHEDTLLTTLVKTCVDTKGRPKWTEIATKIESRNPQECRCRWRRLKEGDRHVRLGLSKNRCKKCGMLRRGHTCLFKHVVKALTFLQKSASLSQEEQLEAFRTLQNAHIA